MKSNKRQRPGTPEICPVCGEDVPRGALACPECGADERSGWRDDAQTYDGIDAGGDEFDYAGFVAAEFGSAVKPPRLRMIWWITAIALLLALAILYFYRR